MNDRINGEMNRRKSIKGQKKPSKKIGYMQWARITNLVLVLGYACEEKDFTNQVRISLSIGALRVYPAYRSQEAVWISYHMVDCSG